MEAVAFQGWCPIQLGDLVKLKTGQSGSVRTIRALQDFTLHPDGRKVATVTFQILIQGAQDFVPLEDVSEYSWWNDKTGTWESRKLQKGGS